MARSEVITATPQRNRTRTNGRYATQGLETTIQDTPVEHETRLNVPTRADLSIDETPQTTTRAPTIETEQGKRINYDAFFRQHYGRPATDRDREKLMDALDGPTELRKKMTGWKSAPTLTDAIYASIETLHISDERIDEQYVLDTIERMAQRSRERKDLAVGLMNRTAPLATAAIIGAIALQMTVGFRNAAYDTSVKAAIASAEQAKTDYAAKQEELLKERMNTAAAIESGLKAQYEDKDKEFVARERALMQQVADKEAALAKTEKDLNERFFGKLPTLTERVQSSFTELETRYFLKQLIVAYNTTAAQVLESGDNTVYDQVSPAGVRIIRRSNMLFKQVDGKTVAAIVYGQNNEMTAAMIVNDANVTYVNAEQARVSTYDNKDRLVYLGTEEFNTYKTQLQKMTDEYRTLQSRGPNGFNVTPEGAQKPSAQKPASEQPNKSGVPLGKVLAGG